MMICKVTGSIVSTHKNEHLNNKKIMIVQPVDLALKPKGTDLLALDRVQAGEGDLVLVVKEGSAVQFVYQNKKMPVQAIIVAVIDDFDIPDQG